MNVRLCVLLWARPGRERELAGYEDAVLPLVAAHGGAVVQRLRTIDPGDGPTEVQVLDFPSEAALDRYMADDRRVALADRRDRAIARTDVLRVDAVG